MSKTAEEILTVAKVEGVANITKQAKEIMKMLFPPNGEISDENWIITLAVRLRMEWIQCLMEDTIIRN